MGTAQAQKAITLDPATVNYSSPVISVSFNRNNFDLEIREDYFNHFANNPIKFVEEKFDFNSLNLDDFEEVEVKFVSSKGYLKATFDEHGELIRTDQQFKNIALPGHIRNQVYKNNLGWYMVNNKYTASGNTNKIDKELYRINLTDGKKMRRLKFSPAIISEGRMVSK